MSAPCDIPFNRRMTAATESEGNITIRGEWGTVTYSAQYSDDTYVYRHIIVPRKMWREITRLTAGKTTPLLTHDEVANHLRIPMSTDWVHYVSHQRGLTLLFRRPRRHTPRA